MILADLIKERITETVYNHLSFEDKDSIYQYHRSDLKNALKTSDRYWRTYQTVEIIVEAFLSFVKEEGSYKFSFRENMINTIMDMIEDKVIVEIEEDKI